MNAERFDECVQQLLDGELSPADAGEFAAALRDHPEHRRSLRQELVVWELWAQQQAPERSADAFLAGCQTRLRAERAGETFVAGVEERIREDAHAAGTDRRGEHRGGVLHWWRALQQPRSAVWTAVATLTLAGLVWLALPRRATATVTLHGEAVCRACALHETHDHLPAIRVQHDGETSLYYVESDPTAFFHVGNYCVAPVPVVTTGRVQLRDGRNFFVADRVAAAP